MLNYTPLFTNRSEAINFIIIVTQSCPCDAVHNNKINDSRDCDNCSWSCSSLSIERRRTTNKQHSISGTQYNVSYWAQTFNLKLIWLRVKKKSFSIYDPKSLVWVYDIIETSNLCLEVPSRYNFKNLIFICML